MLRKIETGNEGGVRESMQVGWLGVTGLLGLRGQVRGHLGSHHPGGRILNSLCLGLTSPWREWRKGERDGGGNEEG